MLSSFLGLWGWREALAGLSTSIGTLNAPGMVAVIASITIIGIIVENVLFKFLEGKIIKKRGMKT